MNIIKEIIQICCLFLVCSCVNNTPKEEQQIEIVWQNSRIVYDYPIAPIVPPGAEPDLYRDYETQYDSHIYFTHQLAVINHSNKQMKIDVENDFYEVFQGKKCKLSNVFDYNQYCFKDTFYLLVNTIEKFTVTTHRFETNQDIRNRSNEMLSQTDLFFVRSGDTVKVKKYENFEIIDEGRRETQDLPSDRIIYFDSLFSPDGSFAWFVPIR